MDLHIQNEDIRKEQLPLIFGLMPYFINFIFQQVDYQQLEFIYSLAFCYPLFFVSIYFYRKYVLINFKRRKRLYTLLYIVPTLYFIFRLILL